MSPSIERENGIAGTGKRRAIALCKPETALDQAVQTLPQEDRPECVRSLYRAIAEFTRQPADVVLLDLDWLSADDLDVVRLMREINPLARIVVVFSITAREKAVEALIRGADAYLIQPFYPAEFRALWHSALVGGRPGAGRTEIDPLQKLVYGFGHEIRNILAALSGNLQILASDNAKPAAERKILQERVEECDRITRLVCRLEDMAEIRRGAPNRVKFDQLLTELVDKVKADTQRNGVKLEAELAAQDVSVVGDETQLRRALEDLLSDAQEALDGHGNLRVFSLKGPDFVEVRIADTGRPVASDVRGRLDEPYAVVTRAHTNNLSIVYAACSGVFRSHGGSLRAELGKDNANEFIVRLPLAS